MDKTLLILFAALVVDRIVGDPDWLWRRYPHPVVFFGRAIGWFDRRFNHDDDTPEARRRAGQWSIAALLACAALPGLVLSVLLSQAGFIGWLIEIVIVAVFLAQKSLADHVLRVADGLRTEGLAGGRKSVSMIVGRDPESLDEAGVCRAAIESLAENFSDGVVAPAFWYAFFGLPGLFAYKMLNTADSMIGHKTPRFLDFGRAAARTDDAANGPAARLAAALVAAAALVHAGPPAGRRALAVARRDAGLHRSPNAGWPEAAMAGAVNIALAGPRVYHGERVLEPFLNAAGRRNPGAADIEDAVSLFEKACSALAILVLAGAIAAY